MKKIKRLLCMVLSLALIVSIVAACSGNDNQTQTDPTPAPASNDQGDTATPADPPDDDDHFTISWFTMSLGDGPMQNGTRGQTLIEEAMNVTIEMVSYDWREPDQISLMLAEGNIPDVFSTGGNHPGGVFAMLIDQGLVRPLDEAMVREHAPSFAAAMDDIAGEQGWGYGTHNGVLYGLARPYAPSQNAFSNLVIRTDWMANVGITKVPETLDELEALLQAWKDGDPTGTGAKVYGLHSYDHQFHHIFGAFGSTSNWDALNNWQIVGDKVMCSPTTDGYKEALKLLADWYDKGFIDPDFPIEIWQRAISWEKFNTGMIGILEADPGWLGDDDAYLGWNGPLAVLTNNDPDSSYAFMNTIKGPGGQGGSMSYFPVYDRLVISKDVSDAKLIRILQMIELVNSDPYWQWLAYWGEEGIDWEIGDDGIAVQTEGSYERLNSEIGGMGIGFLAMPMDMFTMTRTPSNRLAYEHDKANVARIPQFHWNNFGSSPAIDDYGEELHTVSEEYFINAVTGRIDIDSTWDDFLAQWRAMGGAQAEEEINALYQASK